MTATALAAGQSIWSCRWSRPGYRLSCIAEPDQPESAWVCLPRRARTDIAAVGCEPCPSWEPDSITTRAFSPVRRARRWG